MNPWVILVVLLAFAGLGSWATYEDGQAAKWEGNFKSLQVSYALTAQKARDDATAQEQKDLAAINKKSSDAIQQATDAQSKAEREKEAYERKIEAASKLSDLPHKCASVLVPPELIP